MKKTILEKETLAIPSTAKLVITHTDSLGNKQIDEYDLDYYEIEPLPKFAISDTKNRQRYKYLFTGRVSERSQTIIPFKQKRKKCKSKN